MSLLLLLVTTITFNTCPLKNVWCCNIFLENLGYFEEVSILVSLSKTALHSYLLPALPTLPYFHPKYTFFFTHA